MQTKEFKAESKRLLDMMINSIYTHKEIFLREIISNASDAIDKLYFKSLTDTSVGIKKSDFAINIAIDKENRTLTVSDNGIGMTEEDLENNLGTIANSGSFAFKKDNARHLHRNYNFTELMVETVPRSLHHSCRSELTRQGISLP